jgi:hypothetical protein
MGCESHKPIVLPRTAAKHQILANSHAAPYVFLDDAKVMKMLYLPLNL